MKKLFCAVMLLLMGIVGSVSFAKENKVLYVGTNAEFQPFEYLEDGKIVGFDVELMEEIAKLMGKEIEWKNIAFDGLLPALQMKKVDLVIAGMTANEERMKTVSFTQPYYTASQVIIVKDGNDSIKSFADLKGKKVGVMLGFTGDMVVSEIDGVKIERFNAAYAGIMALQAGKVEAIVLDSEPAKNYVAQNKGLVLADADAEQEEYAIAVRKNDKALLEKVEKALSEIKANGTYDKLIQKYFN